MALVVSTSTAILTLPEAKAYPNITGTDAHLQLYIDAVSEVFEEYAGPIVPRTVTQTVAGRGVAILERRVLSVTSILRDGVAVTGYTLNAPAGLLYGVPSGAVVTYVVGFEVIPRAIRLAALEAVQSAAEANAGAVPEGQASGDEVFTLSRGDLLTPRVKALLDPYRQGPTFA